MDKRNLIIQHWNGSLPEWARLATETIRRYANACEADYELVTGYPMGKERGVLAQKLIFLDEKYDKYDQVLLLDTDMVATNRFDNCFNVKGIGRLHQKGMDTQNGSRNGRKWGYYWRKGSPMFFGNYIKLNREQRQTIRPYLPSKAQFIISKDQGEEPNDEIILSYMMRESRLEMVPPLNTQHARFCDLPEEAAPNATLLHFCGGRKRNVIGWIREHRKDIL